MYFFESDKPLQWRYTLTRELELLDKGHLKLSWQDWKELSEEELGEQVGSEVNRLLASQEW